MRNLPLILLLSTMITACYSTGQLDTPANQQSFNQTALTLHNQLRAKHHAPALVWDNQLAKYAENHALTCRFRHSHSPYGENLAAGQKNISEAIYAWYDENKLYSYAQPGFAKSTGHFTQMVWIASRKLGCGYAICDGKNGTPGKYYVCEYSPKGNVINEGYFESNVR